MEERIDLPGNAIRVLAHGQATDGAYTVVEMSFAPGYRVPPHIHANEDEATFVLQGELDVMLDGQRSTVGPGQFVLKPKGKVHAMENAGSESARFLEIYTPGGLENYFRDLARLFAAGEVTPGSVALVQEKFGISSAP